MIIVCTNCAARFESLIVTRERAIAELSKQITLHWTKSHKEEMEVIGKGILQAQMAFAWYISMNSLAFIPKGEKILLEEMEKSLDLTMKALGYDEDELEEDEDLEDEDEDSEPLTPGELDLPDGADKAKSAKIEAETGVESSERVLHVV